MNAYLKKHTQQSTARRNATIGISTREEKSSCPTRKRDTILHQRNHCLAIQLDRQQVILVRLLGICTAVEKMFPIAVFSLLFTCTKYIALPVWVVVTNLPNKCPLYGAVKTKYSTIIYT